MCLLLYSAVVISFCTSVEYCHHHDVGQFYSTTLSGQDIQQQRTQDLTKISQHENSTVHTNIKVVSLIT